MSGDQSTLVGARVSPSSGPREGETIEDLEKIRRTENGWPSERAPHAAHAAARRPEPTTEQEGAELWS